MDRGYQKELYTSLDYLESLTKDDPEQLKKKVYETVSGISFLILEAKKSNFKKGWASKIVDRHDSPLFEKNESRILESATDKFIKPLFEHKEQTGGLVPIKKSSAPSIIQSKIAINPEDLSIDKTFWKVRDFLSSVDAKAKAFSRELGPFRFFYSMDTDFRFPLPIPIPVPPFVSVILVPVNPRAIPIVIGLIIEAIRIIYGVGPMSDDTTRKVLSLVLGLVDILKGDWKQGILSIIGFFGEAPLIAGLVMKTLINILDLIAPDLQEKLTMDLYQSGKSIAIGFLLWGFANFAPELARIAARAQFDALKKIVEEANGKINDVEAAMQKSVDPAGLQLKLKDIPEDFVPTFDDIQNLQTIVRQPTIVCSKEFQEAIQPLNKLPPMRLALELMSIPTDPQSLQYTCKEDVGKSLEDTLGDLATPELSPKGESSETPVLGQAIKSSGLSPQLDSKIPGLSTTLKTGDLAGQLQGEALKQLDSKVPGLSTALQSGDLKGEALKQLDSKVPGLSTALQSGDLKGHLQEKAVNAAASKIARTLKKGGSRKRNTRRR